MRIAKKTLQAMNVNARFFEFMNVVMAPVITAGNGARPDLSESFMKTVGLIYKQCIFKSSKLMFIGNGGGAAIASHQALDFSLHCGIETKAFNDPCFLTCMANDFGFENVFLKQILPVAENGDILAAISSSGKSPDILKGVEAAQKKDCYIITMSGFDENNPLRKAGDLNFYVPSDSYRIVEAAHSLYWDFILEMLIEKCKK